LILTTFKGNIAAERLLSNRIAVFSFFWLVLFVLYLPAAHAGRVGDFPGWVESLRNKSFIDYVNRKGFITPSLYQFTQVLTYIFFRLFGAAPWPWHLLFITLHSVNALLLFTFFGGLLQSAQVRRSLFVAFCGASLFCVTPYNSEVIVWEPAFHYLLAVLLILLILHCIQAYLKVQKELYVFAAGLTFFLSLFSLELFYLTPFFSAALIICGSPDKGTLRKALIRFVAPQVLLFVFYQALLRMVYHQQMAHIGTETPVFTVFNFTKPLKYLFHVLLLGRFFPDAARASVYHFCESVPGMVCFYSLAAGILVIIVARFSRLQARDKVVLLVLFWVMMALGLLLPMWFPDTGLVIYDRYTYLLNAFLFMLLALLLNYVNGTRIFVAAILLLTIINIRYAHKVNSYWQQSAAVVNKLVETFPNDPSKKVLLLNLPECLDGVQMIGSRDDGEFRMSYNALMNQKLPNKVYDVEAAYMRGTTEGAHVNVINDSMAQVVLNQWGTWWIYYGYGAFDYENADYKVQMKDLGHWYYVVLRHPASEYLLLFSVGDQWRKVDWSKKNVDQY